VLGEAYEALKPLVAVEQTGVLTPKMFIDAKDALASLSHLIKQGKGI